MAKCPNCGRRTSGDYYCEWCKYPILKGGSARRRKAEKQAQKEAELAAKEKARKEAEEAKEKAKREAEEAKKAAEAEKQAQKEAEESLKQVDNVCKDLRDGKTGTEEAIQKLKDIADKIKD